MLSLNTHNKYECAICHSEYDTVRTLSLHIRMTHKQDIREYYDEYCKELGDGVCKVCGAPTKFHTLADGYRETCSRKCGSILLKNDPEKMSAKKAKTVATCLERYGVTNAGGTKESLKKVQQTNISKRGVRWAMQSKEVVEKSKATCLDKYDATTYVHGSEGRARVEATVNEKFGRSNFFSGVEGNKAARDGYMSKHGYDHNMRDPQFLEKWKTEQKAKYDGKFYVETDEFKDKSRVTQVDEYGTWYSASEEGRRRYHEIMLRRHGVPEYFQSDEFRNKSKTTCMEKYNTGNISQTPEWKSKVIATNMERYGAEHIMKTLDGKARVAATNMERYGVTNYSNSMDFVERIMRKYIERMDDFECTPIYVDARRVVKFRCNKCGSECIEQPQFIKRRTDAGLTPCSVCHPKNFPVSVEENDLRIYLESLGYQVAHYDRDFLGSYGADMVIEERKIIVEYDGIYWHSELYKDSRYHLEKKIMAEDRGYRLVHVFSDEWKYRTDIVKSRLAHILGVNKCRKVYARDCTVGEVDAAVATKFLDDNHIQGAVNSKWRYGLYENGTLVSLMTFGPSRFDSSTEMLRFCSDKALHVIGAAGKLFTHFINEYTEVTKITSYADARWSTGHVFYEKLGFILEALSSPGYYIVDGDIRRNRMQFQRHKISGPGDEGKTEHDITFERGLFRIYDCGQYRYVWKRSQLRTA